MDIRSGPICDAIEHHRLLRFVYHNSPRTVIPCAHGRLTTGREALRAHEVTGEGVGAGKLFLFDQMDALEAGPERFLEPPALYSRDDRAMTWIHCQL